MFDRLSKLYKGDRITTEGLQNAVTKDWITLEQMEIIIGG